MASIVSKLTLGFLTLLTLPSCIAPTGGAQSAVNNLSSKRDVSEGAVAPPNQVASTIYLADLLPVKATVYNQAWQPLPNKWTATGYQTGMAGYISSTTTPFQDGSRLSSHAMFAVPPGDSISSTTQITFSKIPLERSMVSWLHFKSGITQLALNPSQAYKISIVVQADKNVGADADWKVLDTINVLPGAPVDHWLPLGLWPLRESFVLGMRVQRQGSVNANDLLLIDQASIVYTVPRPLLGINNSASSYSNQDDNAQDPWLMKAVGVKRARIYAPHTGSYGNEASNPVHWGLYWRGLQSISAANPEMKYDLLIMQESDDYAMVPDQATIPGPYGSPITPYLPFSKLDTERFRTRVDALIKRHKDRGIPLEMVQLGNELDFIYSNADVVCDPLQNNLGLQNSAINSFVAKYAATLKLTYEITKKYYPTAKVVTYGAVRGANDWDEKCTFNSTVVMQRLQNFGGVNYVKKYSDAAGLHIYAHKALATIKSHVGTQLSDFSTGLPAAHPVWITEWGFHDRFIECEVAGGYDRIHDCPSRYLAIQEFLEALNSQPASAPTILGANFYVFGQENARDINSSPKVFNGYMPYSLTYYDLAGQLQLGSEAAFLKFYNPK